MRRTYVHKITLHKNYQFLRNIIASSKVKIKDFHKAAGKENCFIDHGHCVNRFTHSYDVESQVSE